MTFRDSTTSGTTSCSRPLYSPSVFSLHHITISEGNADAEGEAYLQAMQTALAEVQDFHTCEQGRAKLSGLCVQHV